MAFASKAADLVVGDTNDDIDVFVRDRLAGTTVRVSVSTAGDQGIDGNASNAEITADGRYVAFVSNFGNLVPNDFQPSHDVFVRDLQSESTQLVSVNSAGVQGNFWSAQASISADGNRVAFSAWANNLVPGDTNTRVDIFVRDRAAGITTRVSVTSDGTQGNGFSYWPSISADGRIVAFESDSENLVPGDTNEAVDIFVHDTVTGETTRASVSSGGARQANDGSFDPRLSADGRYLSFSSGATNLVADDTNGVGDIFVHDCLTGETTRVSVGPEGAQSTAGSRYSSLSADGRFVAFASDAGLSLEDSNEKGDVYLHDRQTAVTTLASVDSLGDEGNLDSLLPRIASNGVHVAFLSYRDDLVPGDTNDKYDVFVHDGLCRPGSVYCSGDGSGTACPCGNEVSGGAGCVNSTGGGGELRLFGTASISADDLVPIANALPGQPALLFVGELRIGGGAGEAFGDGLRCAGGGVVRLGVQTADGDGELTWGPSLASIGGWSAGDTRRFQVWYRDPSGPCGNGFNLSNGSELTFAP